MSTDNSAASRAMFDALLAGDLEGAICALHPDCVFREAQNLPYAGDWHGKDGFRQLTGILFAKLHLRMQGYTLYPSGDTVVVKADVVFRSRASGRSLTMPVVEIHRIQDGLIIDADIYYKDAVEIQRLAAETN